MIAKLHEYRKGVIAVSAAVVTVANLAGFPLAESLPDAVVGVYDSVVAVLVIVVPNKQ